MDDIIVIIENPKGKCIGINVNNENMRASDGVSDGVSDDVSDGVSDARVSENRRVRSDELSQLNNIVIVYRPYSRFNKICIPIIVFIQFMVLGIIFGIYK